MGRCASWQPLRFVNRKQMLNYLKETLAFMKAIEQAPVSPRAQALWHHLIFANNQAAILGDDGRWYWPVWFEADNTVLVRALGIKESKQLYKYRKALIDRGYIRFKKQATPTGWTGGGDGRTPASPFGSVWQYALVPFTEGFERTCLHTVVYPQGIWVWKGLADTGETADELLPNCINNINALNPLNVSHTEQLEPDAPLRLTSSEIYHFHSCYPDREERLAAIAAYREAIAAGRRGRMETIPG